LYMKVGKDKLSADFFVSTIPLHNLIKILKPAPEKEVTDAAMKLKYKDSSIIYFLIKKGRVLKENWIFFPEKNIIFNRVSEQKSFSQQTCPKDKTALMVETTREVDKETLEIVKGQLIKLGFFQEEDIEEILVKKLEKAYPIYDKGYKKNLDIVLGYLDKISNLITIGRHGLFNYNNIDQCWDMARKLDEHLTGNKTGEEWVETRKIFDKYTIVD
jgi:protoporphyrinogen oxidase